MNKTKIPNYRKGFNYERYRVCKSCGAAFTGRFCNRCGEKVLERSDRTIKSLVAQVIQSLTFAESKFLKSLILLLKKPGLLSRELTQGRKVAYSSLVSLFFLANLIYFLFPLFETFNTQLQVHMTGQFYSSPMDIEHRVLSKIAVLQIPLEAYQMEFNQAVATNSKLLLVVIAPLFAMVLSLVCYRRNALFADHIVFSLELLTFSLWFSTITVSYVSFLGFKLLGVPSFNLEQVFTSVITVLTIYFLISGLRRFYGYSIRSSIVRGIFLLAGFFLVVLLYRWILFEITFFTL